METLDDFLARKPGIEIPGLRAKKIIKGSANNGFGIDAQTDNNRVSIENMAFNNVGVAIRLKGADAARISGSWIA